MVFIRDKLIVTHRFMIINAERFNPIRWFMLIIAKPLVTTPSIRLHFYQPSWSIGCITFIDHTITGLLDMINA